MVKKILLILLGIILFVALIFEKFDYSTFVATISTKISWPFYFFISILISFQLVFRALRFSVLFNNAFKKKIVFSDSYFLTSAIFFIALITPNKIGDTLRGLLYKSQQIEITAISFIEFLLDTLVVVLIPLVGIFLIDDKTLIKTIIGYVIIVLFAMGVVIYLLMFGSRILNINFHQKYKNKINSFQQYFKKGFDSRISLVVSFFYTALTMLIYFMAFYIVLRKLGGEISYVETLFAASAGLLIGAMSFIPMGIGTRDVTAYAILISNQVVPEIALSAIIIMRSLSMTLILISGLCYFIAIRRFL